MNKQVLEAKQSVVSEIVEKAKGSSTLVVAEYRGLTVAQLQELRRALAKEESELCVYKNSLVERAVKELGYEGLDEVLTGPNAIVFSKEVAINFAGIGITEFYFQILINLIKDFL